MSKKNPSVLWNVDQSLTASEKAKARENIGVSLANNTKSGSALTFVTGASVTTDGVIKLNRSDVEVSNSYDSTSASPASGQAIAEALGALDVSMPGYADIDHLFVKYVTQADGTVEQHRQQPQIADIDGLTEALAFSAGTDLILTGKEFKVNTTGNDYKSNSSISYSFVTGASTYTPHSYSFAGGYNSIAGGFTVSGSTYTPSINHAAGGASGAQTMFSFGNSCRVNMCDAFALGCNNTIIDDKDGNTRAWYGETGTGALGAGNTISNAYNAIAIGKNNTISTGCHNTIAIGNDNTLSTDCHHNILIGQLLNSCGGDVPHLILGTYNDTASNAAGWGLTAGSLSRITGGGSSNNNRINIEELTWTGLLWTRQGFSTSIEVSDGVSDNYVNDASMFIDTDSSLPAFRLRHGKYTDALNYQEVSLYATNTEIGLWRNDKVSGSGGGHNYSRSIGFRNIFINDDYVPVMEFGDTSSSVMASRGTTGFVQMPQKSPAHPTETNYSSTRLKLYGDRADTPLSAPVGNLQVGTLTVRFVKASDCATEATALLPSYQQGELTFIYNDFTDSSSHQIYMHCGDYRDPNDPERVIGYMYHYPITNYCAAGRFTIFATSVAAGTNQGGEIINYGYFSQLTC